MYHFIVLVQFSCYDFYEISCEILKCANMQGDTAGAPVWSTPQGAVRNDPCLDGGVSKRRLLHDLILKLCKDQSKNRNRRILDFAPNHQTSLDSFQTALIWKPKELCCDPEL